MTTEQPDISQQTRKSLLQMLSGMRIARAIHIAARHKIADLLKDGPKDSADLATQSHTDASALYTLLKDLSDIGVFQEIDPGRFANTELSAILRSDIPGSLYYSALYSGSDWQWQTWGALDYTITTGQRAFDHIFNMTTWEYLASHPEEEHIFNRAMMSYSAPTIAAIARNYDFAGMHTIADIGGGEGGLLIAILKANPHLQGILVDRASVLESAHQQILSEGLESRCQCIASDFFHAIPGGADIYIFKNVLHDWDDAQCLQILKVCREAIAPHSKLLIVEQLRTSQRSGPLFPCLNLQMRLLESGHERTQEEFRTLLSSAGFRMLKLTPVPSATIIEGEPLPAE